jgi:hypothetical protein
MSDNGKIFKCRFKNFLTRNALYSVDKYISAKHVWSVYKGNESLGYVTFLLMVVRSCLLLTWLHFLQWSFICIVCMCVCIAFVLWLWPAQYPVHLDNGLANLWTMYVCKYVCSERWAPHGCFLHQNRRFSFKWLLSYPHEAEWTPLQTHCYSGNMVALGNELGIHGSIARNSDHYTI